MISLMDSVLPFRTHVNIIIRREEAAAAAAPPEILLIFLHSLPYGIARRLWGEDNYYIHTL